MLIILGKSIKIGINIGLSKLNAQSLKNIGLTKEIITKILKYTADIENSIDFTK